MANIDRNPLSIVIQQKSLGKCLSSWMNKKDLHFLVALEKVGYYVSVCLNLQNLFTFKGCAKKLIPLNCAQKITQEADNYFLPTALFY